MEEKIFKSKIIIYLFLIISLCALISINIFLWHTFVNNTNQYINQTKKTALSNLENQLTVWLNDLKSHLLFLSKQKEIRNLSNKDKIKKELNGIPDNIDLEKRKILDDFMDNNHDYSVIFILVPNGDFYLCHPYETQKSLVINNLSHRDYFKKTLKTKKPVTSRVILGADQKPAIVYNIPIIEKNKIIAHLGGVIHLKKMIHILKNYFQNDIDFVLLFDSNKKLIAHSDIIKKKFNLNKSYLEYDFINTIYSEENKKIRFTETIINNEEYKLLYKTMDNGWKICLISDSKYTSDFLFKKVSKLIILTSFIFIIFLILGIIVLKFYGKKWETAETKLFNYQHGLETELQKKLQENIKIQNSLKKTKIRYQKMFEYMQNCVVVYTVLNNGEKFVFKEINKAVEKIENVDRKNIIGKEVTKVFPGVIEFGLLDILKKVYVSGEPEHFPVKQYKDNRISGWRENYVYKLPASNDIVVIYKDVTEKKIAEMNLKESREKLKKLNENLEHIVEERTEKLKMAYKELESFSYSVSHDLRTPLRSIDGFSQALSEDCYDKLDDMEKDYLIRIRKATQKMGQLIDDLLILSRVTRHEINIKKICLSDLITETVHDIKTAYSHNVETEIEKNIFVKADYTLLKTGIRNLIDNAFKYTQTVDNPKIKFGKLEKNNKIIYYINDNGVGFDKKYYDKLFIAFQRLHSEKQFKGTGIGLATVKRVINKHNGEIWAESKINKGTTFYFTL